MTGSFKEKSYNLKLSKLQLALCQNIIHTTKGSCHLPEVSPLNVPFFWKLVASISHIKKIHRKKKQSCCCCCFPSCASHPQHFSSCCVPLALLSMLNWPSTPLITELCFTGSSDHQPPEIAVPSHQMPTAAGISLPLHTSNKEHVENVFVGKNKSALTC